MSAPIVIQIVDKIEDAIALISTTGGYSRNVKRVYRPRMVNLSDYTPEDGTVIVTMGACNRNRSTSAGKLRWTQVVHVYPCCLPGEWEASDIDTVVRTFTADIQKCLDAADPQWGGLAVDSWVESVSPVETNGKWAAADVELHVDFSTSMADPTAL